MENFREEKNVKGYVNANAQEWENYFSNLYSKHKESKSNSLMNYCKEKLNSSFIMNELKVTIKELKNGKASGYDNILNEFLKLSTERILKLL